MANPELKTTVVSDAVKTMYERRLLIRALPRLVHGRWAEKPMIRGYGTIEFRRYPQLPLVSSALSEGVTPAEQTYAQPTLITVSPTYYGSWIGFSDRVELEVYDPLLSVMSGVLGEQCGISADTIIRDTLHVGASALFANGKTANNQIAEPADKITYKDLVYMMVEMENRGAIPVNGNKYILIIHPYIYGTLMLDSTFVNMMVQEETSGDSAIRTGYVGTLLRMDIYVSSNAKVYVGAGSGTPPADVYAALLIAKESHGILGITGVPRPADVDTASPEGSPLTGREIKPVEIIVKPVGSSGAADPLNQRGSIGWKMALTPKVLNQNWLVSYRTAKGI
jgi:N4-gp56 family major capsid protein